MKKSILGLSILLIMLSVVTSVFASATNDFTIDVPSKFIEAGTNIYAATDGSSFNIQITDYDQKKSGYPYTQANLDDYAKTLEASGATVSSKSISTCSKNNYKCLKVEAKVLGAYCRQYLIVSGDKAYALTLGATDEATLNGSELSAVEASFTINNYQEPKEPGMSPVVIGAIVGAAVGAVAGVVGFLKNKKNSEATSQKNEVNNTENK